MKKFKATDNDASMRTDVFITAMLPQFARSALRGLFERKEVLVNGQPAKPGYKLKVGDAVAVDTKLLDAKPAEVELPVIYEDSDVVVINKPAGMLTHSKGALNLEPTVASFINGKIKDKSLSGNRAGIVHRLDRSTSGLIVCAKTAQALNYLQKQFSSRKVKKTYLAVVEGTPEETAAVIEAPIARNPKKPQTFKVASSGKYARTKYKVLSQSLVELMPETGRTHQLRVHMAYIGHPVVGDAIYGHRADNMMLHAYKLELALPGGRKKSFMAEPPAYFKEYLTG